MTEARRGRPEDLTEADRKRAASQMGMPPAHRKLCEASGKVTDARRLVAFIYLILRDTLPCGVMGEIMLRWADSERGVVGEMEASMVVGQLVDEAVSPEPVSRWLAFTYECFPDGPGTLDRLLKQIPDKDDITTVFTNGWLARYAQYIADQITGDSVSPGNDAREKEESEGA